MSQEILLDLECDTVPDSVWHSLNLPAESLVSLRNFLYQQQEKLHNKAQWHFFWAKIEQKLGMPDAALQCLHNTLAIAPHHSDALHEMGLALVSSGQLPQAMKVFEQLVATAPDHWQGWNDGGCALRAMGQHASALHWMQQAFAAHPTQGTLAANIALLAYELHQYDDAQTWLDTAFALDDTNPEALHTQAMLQAGLGLHEDAYETDLLALSVKPNYPQVRLSLALTDLTLGRWKEGFAGYEYRWVGSDKADTQTMPTIGRPQWHGQPIYAGSRIAILPEQGLGDHLQFAQLIPQLFNHFYEVVWQVPNEVYRLFADSFSQYEELTILPASAPVKNQQIDFELPLMSLPFALSLTPETLPQQAGYLRADEAASLRFQQALSHLNGLKVGIAWTGKGTLGKQALRLVPTDLLGLLDDVPVQFISLQKFDQVSQVQWPALTQFTHLMDDCHDFYDTAALIQQLDLVISVDTSVAHLAAAMGKPTWLLNRLGSEWRWMHQRSDSPWYPTMTLYNQHTLNDWTDVLMQVKSDLIALVSAQENCHV